MTSTSIKVLGTAAAAMLLGGGVAYAGIPESDGTIHAWASPARKGHKASLAAGLASPRSAILGRSR